MREPARERAGGHAAGHLIERAMNVGFTHIARFNPIQKPRQIIKESQCRFSFLSSRKKLGRNLAAIF